MNNGLWTTDRKPTSKDAPNGYVWTTTNDRTGFSRWDAVKDGVPWMPMLWPDPYEKPKRARVVEERRYNDDGWEYAVTFGIGTVARHIPSREAAERIAAIYEEVMP